MRFVLAACAVAAISGCASARAQPAAEPLSSRPPQAETEIRLGEQTRVCVTVSIDEALWTEPRLPDREQANRDFSSHLGGELERLFALSGGERYLMDEGLGEGPRFVQNFHGRNPRCQVNRDLIHVIARYKPRRDGTPFLLEYTIRQSGRMLTRNIERDVRADVARGAIVALYGAPVLTRAIADEMEMRAREIYALIT
jgi:hypothetical protein